MINTTTGFSQKRGEHILKRTTKMWIGFGLYFGLIGFGYMLGLDMGWPGGGVPLVWIAGLLIFVAVERWL